MKKTLVKITSVFLTLIMLFSVVVTGASAEEIKTYGNLYYSTDSNKVTIIGGLNLSGKIEIPSSINGNPVVAVADKAFSGRESITEIVLPSGIEVIGNNAFENCLGLQTVSLPDTLKIIGEYAFAWCSSLKKAEIPSSVEDIRERAFWGCSSLVEIELSTENLTHLGGFVFGATAYSENESNRENGVIYIGNQIIDTDPAQARGNITVRNGSVLLPDYSFYYCNGVNEVIIPDSVGYIGDYSFEGCWDLVKLTLGSNAYNAHPVSGITKTFVSENNPYYSNDRYGNLYSKDKSIFYGYASGGYDAASFTVPSSVKTIASGAFSHCESLEYVTIGNSVEIIEDNAFCFCSNLKRVILGNNIKSVGDQAFLYVENPEVYYSGTQEEWKLISWGNFNERINNENVNLNFDMSSIGKDTTISLNSAENPTSVDYNKTVSLIAEVSNMPDGAYLKWTVSGNALEISKEYNGFACTVKAVNGGTGTVKIQVVDQNGDVLENTSDEINITVNDGIFQRITAFFENLIANILAFFGL